MAEILPVLPDLDYASVGKSGISPDAAFLKAGWETYERPTFRISRCDCRRFFATTPPFITAGPLPDQRRGAIFYCQCFASAGSVSGDGG